MSTSSKIEEDKKSSGSRSRCRKSYPKGKTPSKVEQSAWKARIQKVNASRWTPQLKAQFARQAKSFQIAELRKKKCKRMERANKMATACFAQGMSVWTPSSRNYAADKEEAVRSSTTSLVNMSRLQRMVSSDADDDVDEEMDMSDVMTATVRSARADAAMDELEVELEKDGVDTEGDEMEKLLNELRKEPKDDTGRETKFKLYEKYQETIQDARKALFKFWNDCKKEFGATDDGGDDRGKVAAVKQVESDLKKVDDARNLGFPDFQSDCWFVYHMAVKVTKNNAMLGDVLKGIQTKLDVLSKQDDCPICLEPLDEDPNVLGCCHKVCTECWANWKEMQGTNAFCPLCKHNDFLGSVMADTDDDE